jgi:S-adenosylmethionine uptake transporter
MALRSVAGTALMLPVWLGRRGRWPAASTIRLHALRAVVAGVMAVLFFYGVVRTPLAEGIALSFIAPLIALSRRHLAGRARGAARGGRIAAGADGRGRDRGGQAWWALFRRRGEGLAPSLFPPCSMPGISCCSGAGAVSGPEEVAFFQNAVTALVLLPGLLWVAPAPTPAALGWIVTSAALSAASLMLMTWAYARAETRVLVPLEYTAFIWAAIVGWLMFGEALTLRTLAGVALIVAGCLIAVRAGKADAASAGKVPEPAA